MERQRMPNRHLPDGAGPWSACEVRRTVPERVKVSNRFGVKDCLIERRPEFASVLFPFQDGPEKFLLCSGRRGTADRGALCASDLRPQCQPSGRGLQASRSWEPWQQDAARTGGLQQLTTRSRFEA